MQRLRPTKPKITIFAFGEGQTERAFLQYLRSIYTRGCGVSVKVDYAGGKDPEHVVSKGVAIKKEGAYDLAFILMDTDRQWTDDTLKKAKENNFELIGSEPCLEGLFLSILEPNFNPAKETSKHCKEMFEQKYGRQIRNKYLSENYNNIFGKERLDVQRVKIIPLNRIIQLMKGESL